MVGFFFILICKNITNCRYTYMIVLTTTTDAQTFYVITRTTSVDVRTVLTDDITGTEYTGVGVYELYGDYLKCSLEFVGLLENRFYTLRVEGLDIGEYTTERTIYKDKVFVTNQTIDQLNDETYTINKNEYVEQETSNNDYIVI